MQVHISGQFITRPHECACCAGIPDREIDATARRTTGKRVKRTQEKTWSFPYCSACMAHKQKWDGAIGALFAGIGVGVVLILWGWVAKTLAFALPLALLLVGVACLVTYFGIRAANALRHEDCTSASATVRYLGWNGSVHSFDIDSEYFALALMHANRTKLVNVPPALWSLLNTGGIDQRSTLKRK